MSVPVILFPARGLPHLKDRREKFIEWLQSTQRKPDSSA